jgi:hypothetical protein
VARPRPADYAWAAIISGAVAYELVAEDLLSDAADRLRVTHPWLLRVVVVAVGGHLSGLVPARMDVFNARNIIHRSILRALGGRLEARSHARRQRGVGFRDETRRPALPVRVAQHRVRPLHWFHAEPRAG